MIFSRFWQIPGNSPVFEEQNAIYIKHAWLQQFIVSDLADATCLFAGMTNPGEPKPVVKIVLLLPTRVTFPMHDRLGLLEAGAEVTVPRDAASRLAARRKGA